MVLLFEVLLYIISVKLHRCGTLERCLMCNTQVLTSKVKVTQMRKPTLKAICFVSENCECQILTVNTLKHWTVWVCHLKLYRKELNLALQMYMFTCMCLCPTVIELPSLLNLWNIALVLKINLPGCKYRFALSQTSYHPRLYTNIFVNSACHEKTCM